MSEKSADMWNQAAVAGLSLGGVSIAYMLLTYLLGLLPEGAAFNVLTSVLNLLLWVGKLVGCILLLRFFIRKYASSDIEASHSKSFKFGALVAFLSALVYSAAYMGYCMLNLDQITEVAVATLNSLPGATQQMYDMVDSMMPKMPTMGFFMNLGWCTLYGVIVSAILSQKIPDDNPFRG